MYVCTHYTVHNTVQHLEPDPLSAPVSGASPNSSQTQQLQAAWRAEQQHTATRHSTSSNGNGTAAANGNDSEAEDDDDDDNVSATSDGDDGDSPEERSLQNGEEQEEQEENEDEDEDSDAPSDNDDGDSPEDRSLQEGEERAEETHSPTAAERARAAQRTLQALALGSSNYLGDAPRREGYLYKQRDTLQTRWSYRRRYFVLGESSSSAAMQLSFYKSKEVSFGSARKSYTSGFRSCVGTHSSVQQSTLC
jgi:hypothetical protein